VRGGLFEGKGKDRVWGGPGIDRLRGGRGDDSLRGGGDDDAGLGVIGIDGGKQVVMGAVASATVEPIALLEEGEATNWTPAMASSNDCLDGGPEGKRGDLCRSDPDSEANCELD
jgi:Ca2+-binding RTX toxin-like protein